MNVGSAAPKIFISYSHDSPEHKDRVLQLANRLRAEGVNCNIDQYEVSPDEGWPRWMMNQLEWADFVVVVCTEQYGRRFRGREEPGIGRGVAWEGAIITQEFYDSHVKSTKFVPVIFCSKDENFIPIIIRGFSRYNLLTENEYKAFYRHLTNQPLNPKPPLGERVELAPLVLPSLPARNRQQYFLNESQYANLREELVAASKGLLNWKRTLGDNQEIERPELEQLINSIDIEEFSTNIVLGVPGCGKSSLLAKLGQCIVDKGYALLAIKADFLNNKVNSLADLRSDDQLNLSVSLQEAIKAIANKEKIVLLVDQLDAVSELIDRHSGRLNVLLTLIQSVAGTKGVHIVATCREFEFRHGSQFARLEGFEQLYLNLPTWEKISPLLEYTGHIALGIGEPLRELLQNPLHLKIFLEVAKPGEIFDSSQKLLDRLWETRILNQPNASKYIVFLEQITQRMTQEEVLWLPIAAADSCLEVYQALVQAGILMTNQDNSTFGFCHQTYYDHTLARAFARDSQSLVDLVLERQDGLFVRPILLRGLNYLRGTAPKQYAKQLQLLLHNAEAKIFPLKNKIVKLAFKILTHFSGKIRLWALIVLRSLQLIYVRTHIYTLLIEFLGSQQNPEPIEVELLIPLLNLETEAPKILDAIIASPGWFNQLYNCSEFRQWLEKPSDEASYCLPILIAATSFASDKVWNLIEEYWLEDTAYDALSMQIIFNFQQWNPERVWQTQQIIRRFNFDMYSVSTIAEKVAETLPQLAPRIIRAHLDYRLEQAIAESNKPIPELPANASDVQRYIHVSRHNPKKILISLLEGRSDFDDIDALAKANPKYFLDAIWPWFTDLISKIVDQEELVKNTYYEDYIDSFDFYKSEIIQAVLSAILELANQNIQAFLNFVNQNEKSESLIVHRLLARGLVQIAPQEPQLALNYLLGDSRRLSLGDFKNAHKETKKLIVAVVPHIQQQDRISIEQLIKTYNYYHTNRKLTTDLRLSFLKTNRQHRLKLILFFPEKYLSVEAKRWRDEEMRAFPWVINEKNDNYPTIAQTVGAPMNVKEMSCASDQNLLNLFNELSNMTETDYFTGKRDLSRAGGESSQAYEFGKLIKDNPERFFRILPQLQPQHHGRYAGNAIRELVENGFPTNNLIELVENLEQRGFISEEFRSDTASALEKISERNQGLPKSILSQLENWLLTHPKPELKDYRSKEEESSHQLKSSIVFNTTTSHTLPSGRGSIVRAIAAGYLEQNPPDLQNWARVIKSRLEIEPHPAVWVDILTQMPPLLNGDRTQATQLFDAVIRNCPEVLRYRWALYFLFRTVGWFEPKETVQGWLEMLWADGSNFCRQAYGELLFIHYFQYQDEWSVAKIDHHLANQNDEAVLCGLAHVASHLWIQRRCRTKAAEILYNLAPSNIEAIQSIVASVFFQSREHFELDSGMRLLIQAVCKNKQLLIKAASDIIGIIENNNFVDTEPQLVSEICQSLLNQLGEKLDNPTRSLVFAAESLTTLAIQLHRQNKYREIGLNIFEQLLSLNLRETRSALEVLDRKPNRLSFYQAPRRRRRRRQIPSGNK
ncbi:MAG: TIR domain-containing protein [Nostoc sp. DedSLP03]|uniref:SEFIR domain-containing protein n=1 Tax=Nostoc sp. DedSLP03 TaxID=3075400 RepID=UPI002AD204A3|nr:SEFIR domain-containing protein [Nostoc sp. DedSLP03]MDZ7970666.1 TIR domain-containing protein [Nostoc sp. DedSLP03]